MISLHSVTAGLYSIKHWLLISIWTPIEWALYRKSAGILWWMVNLIRRMKMEQKIGSVGDIQESYSKGVVSVQGSAAFPANSFGLSLKVSIEGDLDAKVLIGYLAQKIGGPIPAEVASFLELALAAV